jgi:hypothetical protein
MPTANGVSLFTNNSPVLTGNVAVSGANSFININGINISPYSGMMKNRIINGDMRIDQRFAGAANNNTANWQYVVDRWAHFGTSVAKIRCQQNNTNGPGSSATQAATGFLNYFGANVVSSNTINAGDVWDLMQSIEGHNTADLGWGTANAAPVTLSFWSYSSIAGTHGGCILSSNGSRSYPFTYSINTANTWQYQTITIPGDTSAVGTNWYANNNIGMYVLYMLSCGTNYATGQMNTWNNGVVYPSVGNNVVQVVNNANGSFYLTGVQLEKGLQATAFEFRHYTTELSLCHRYYYRLTNPANYTYIGNGRSINATYGDVLIHVPVPMRVTPVLGYSSLSHLQCNFASTLTLFSLGGSQSGLPTTGYLHSVGPGSATAGLVQMLQFNNASTSAWVDWSAELQVQN